MQPHVFMAGCNLFENCSYAMRRLGCIITILITSVRTGQGYV